MNETVIDKIGNERKIFAIYIANKEWTYKDFIDWCFNLNVKNYNSFLKNCNNFDIVSPRIADKCHILETKASDEVILRFPNTKIIKGIRIFIDDNKIIILNKDAVKSVKLLENLHE